MTKEDTGEIGILSSSWFRSSWLGDFLQQQAIVHSAAGASGITQLTRRILQNSKEQGMQVYQGVKQGTMVCCLGGV